jgi:hypothetical protein
MAALIVLLTILFIVSSAVVGCLFAANREQAERIRRLERDRRIGELERDLAVNFPALPASGSYTLAHVVGALLRVWLREKYRR